MSSAALSTAAAAEKKRRRAAAPDPLPPCALDISAEPAPAGGEQALALADPALQIWTTVTALEGGVAQIALHAQTRAVGAGGAVLGAPALADLRVLPTATGGEVSVAGTVMTDPAITETPMSPRCAGRSSRIHRV